MAFSCAEMLVIVLELAMDDPAYEDVASKLFEHYFAITDALNTLDGTGLWDEEDGFYYDHLHLDGKLIPLFATEVITREHLEHLPDFHRRLGWIVRHRSRALGHLDLPGPDAPVDRPGYLLTLPSQQQLERLLRYVFDEAEFLSPFGVRSLSRVHAERPYVFRAGDTDHVVSYVSGEADSGLFDGNSNWRGPVWFPVNFLLVETLRRYASHYGDGCKVECPTGSGRRLTLHEAADELAGRLIRLFLPDDSGQRPSHGNVRRYRDDPHWRDLVLLYEYYDGDTGRGCGASHQTGWSALVASLIRDRRT